MGHTSSEPHETDNDCQSPPKNLTRISPRHHLSKTDTNTECVRNEFRKAFSIFDLEISPWKSAAEMICPDSSVFDEGDINFRVILTVALSVAICNAAPFKRRIGGV